MGKGVIRSTLVNLLGCILPLILSIVTIPLIIKGFGVDRYGILTIAWLLVAYFGLFDFGLSRATTRFMSNSFSINDRRLALGYFWTSLYINFVIGILGGVILALISPWLIGSVLKIQVALKLETLQAFYWLALSVPCITVSASLVGALESQHQFTIINKVQIPIETAIKLAPLAILLFSQRIDIVVISFVFIRVISIPVYYLYCLKTIPDLLTNVGFNPKLLGKMFNYGVWLTVTNIVGPLMTYMDRFIIGSLLSMRELVYYSTPADLVRKIQIFPASLSRTLFPIFGEENGTDSNQHNIYQLSLKYLVIFITPVVVILIILAHPILDLWLGSEFSSASTFVMQILAVGALINALAKPPYAFIQGAGHPEVTAKFHLLQFPIYICMLYFLVNKLGANGVALAWTIRVLIDTVLLRIYATRMMQKTVIKSRHNLLKSEITAFIVILFALYFSAYEPLNIKLVIIVGLNVMFFTTTWFTVLTDNEKNYLISIMKTLLRAN